MTTETIISICLGIGLSASVGFRVFLPLFALSLAAYFDVWQLNESWQWVGSTAALITLGVATLVEVFAYFIPYVDNLLDSIAVPLAALAGTAIMLSTVADLSPLITWSLAIIAGGGTAAAVAGTSSTARLASTAATGRIGQSGGVVLRNRNIGAYVGCFYFYSSIGHFFCGFNMVFYIQTL